jgi:hypothetical protein
MKTPSLRDCPPVQWLFGLALLGGAVALAPGAELRAEFLKPPFVVRSYGGKCLDFGPPPQVKGSPVFIYDCNGTIAQQVSIEEVDDRHDVILRAGDKVIGVKEDVVIFPAAAAPAAGVAPEPETPLELQNEASRLTILSRPQVFALDGDSIILAANRNLVVQVQNNRGANRTPLVLGPRNLADAEFWTFSGTGPLGAAFKPTSGFVRVGPLPGQKDLASALGEAHWGTVIEVDDAGIPFNLKNLPALQIAAGVTIRGDRRNTHLGPELWAPNDTDQMAPGAMLDIAGDQVRITGLRIRGPTPNLDTKLAAQGILAHDRFMSIIDHNDLSEWPSAAVAVTGDDVRDHRDPRSRPQNVRIARNFFHHNQRAGFGYGVVMGYGGYPLIEGNTFLSNRHAIAGSGGEFDGYRAWFNLVQYPAPHYGDDIEQDFDMHGLLDTCGMHCGGIAGEYMEIAGNTFLGSNRYNFVLRGTPTVVAEMHRNVMRESLSDSIKMYGDLSKLIVTDDNQFGASNPTDRLGVGDFDGDGKQDLFLATGAAWYYAPAGTAEWRFLNAQTDKIDNLLFGDFDGDGRTDVFTQHGRDWLVSWGGASKWEKINESDARMSDFAIGDFNGDHRADVFYADGVQWYVSFGGIGGFTPINSSSFRIADLRFGDFADVRSGDFKADGQTDVFSVVTGQWAVSYGGTSEWTPLRPKLSNSVAELIVADFNGDGRADVATPDCSGLGCTRLKVSHGGIDNWTTLGSPGLPLTSTAAIGRFDGNTAIDVLLWHDYYLDIASGGSGPSHRQSRQEMR